MKFLKVHLLPLLAYSVLILGMTWPLVFNMETSIYGFPHDNIGTMWRMWALDKAADEGLDPHAFDYLNYPEGVDLVKGHIPSPTSDALMRVFGAAIQDKYVAFNLLTMFKFLLCAYFFYLFAYSVTSNFLASLACGFFFAFSPYMVNMAKPYGPNFIPAFLPLAFLGLVRFLKKPGLKAFLAFLALYALFFGDNYYHSYFFTVSATLALVLFLPVPGRFGFNILQALKAKVFAIRPTRNKAVVLALALAAVAVGGIMLYETIAPHAAGRHFSMSEAVMRSARPFLYFTPSITSTFLGHLSLKFVHENLFYCEYFEQTLYLGFVPVLLVLVCLVLNRLLDSWKRKVFAFFFVLMLVSMVLAMGPYIPLDPFNYRHYDTIREYPHMVGPSALFFWIAPMFRFLCRYQAVTVFSLVTCFAIGLDFLMSRFARPVLKYGLPALVCGLVFFEYADVHWVNTTNVWEHQPEVYKRLAEDNATYPVAEANDMDWPSRLHLLAYQIFHEKKLARGERHYFKEDIHLGSAQEWYRDRGFKYLTVVTKFRPVTYFPLQIRWPEPSLPFFPRQDKLACLELVRAYEDSLLFEFTDSCVDVFNVKDLSFSGDFYDYESLPGMHWRWSGPTGVITFANPNDYPICVDLEATLHAPGGSNFTIATPFYERTIPMNSQYFAFMSTVPVDARASTDLAIHSDSPPADFPGDPRNLVFKLINYKVFAKRMEGDGCGR